MASPNDENAAPSCSSSQPIHFDRRRRRFDDDEDAISPSPPAATTTSLAGDSSATSDESPQSLVRHDAKRRRIDDRGEHVASQPKEINVIVAGAPTVSSLGDVKTSGGVTVQLNNATLWNEFHRIGTEMIVTKAGRRVFPYLEFVVRGLDPQALYSVGIEIYLIDDTRYKFMNSSWLGVACDSEATAEVPVIRPSTFTHEKSPATGEFWMGDVVSFKTTKITNHEENSKGHLFVKSMHKYGIRMWIALKERESTEHRMVFREAFPVCEFIAVTSYQNKKITEMKVKKNNYAKAFRRPTGKDLQPAFPTPPATRSPSHASSIAPPSDYWSFSFDPFFQSFSSQAFYYPNAYPYDFTALAPPVVYQPPSQGASSSSVQGPATIYAATTASEPSKSSEPSIPSQFS